MNLDLTSLQNQGTLLAIKVGFLIVLGFTEIFLLVLHKQIHSMNNIVTQPDMFPYLQTFMFLLEAVGIILIILTLVIL